jgi:pyruvate formate-lyase activating enzyme-like uncharacterized protein
MGRIAKTGWYSYRVGKVAKGCQLCVKGSKLVLFVTGLCPRSCDYCPISDKKHNKDVVYADEWPSKDVSDIIMEAGLIRAEGAGITGGDPLCRLDRTITYIKALKKRFGKKFHIHLYSSFDLVNDKNLRRLYNAGLDEIRFHADIDNDKLWHRIDLVKRFKWDVGVEIPVIPNKFVQTKRLIDFFAGKIDFLNLNELEVADNNFSRIGVQGFKRRDNLSYGIKGSEEMALKLLDYVSKNHKNLNVHYCTAKLKDKIQLSNRIKRRAKSVAKAYDVINEDGTLFRGAIYAGKSENFRKCLSKLKEDFSVPDDLVEFDNERDRILVASWVVDELKCEIRGLGFRPALVEEYPTWDNLEVSKVFL